LLSESVTECSKGILESLWNGKLLLAVVRQYKEPQWQMQSDQLLASSKRQALEALSYWDNFLAVLLFVCLVKIIYFRPTIIIF